MKAAFNLTFTASRLLQRDLHSEAASFCLFEVFLSLDDGFLSEYLLDDIVSFGQFGNVELLKP